jgi:membrane-bound lytic murein transglycosylase D
MTYYREHKLVPVATEFPLFTDTILINREMHLMQVAEVLDLPIGMLRDINPQYRRDVIPAALKPLPLRLPVNYTSMFIEHQDSIYSFMADSYLSRENLTITPGNPGVSSSPPAGRVQVNYTVKQGDNLGFISEWFNVGLSDLRNWNNIRGNVIRTGQRLVIFVPT